MPVNELGRHFSDSRGAPTKELYSMAGLVFLADFFGWTPQDALEAYIFRSDVQYALNLEPGAAVSTRSLERYQKLFRDDELAACVFDDVTTRLIQTLDLDVSRQRLDSTHVFSHMASFGHTKLMAWRSSGSSPSSSGTPPTPTTRLPEDLRRRYEPSQVAALRRRQGPRGPRPLPPAGRRGSPLRHRPLRQPRRPHKPIDL